MRLTIYIVGPGLLLASWNSACGDFGFDKANDDDCILVNGHQVERNRGAAIQRL